LGACSLISIEYLFFIAHQLLSIHLCYATTSWISWRVSSSVPGNKTFCCAMITSLYGLVSQVRYDASNFGRPLSNHNAAHQVKTPLYLWWNLSRCRDYIISTEYPWRWRVCFLMRFQSIWHFAQQPFDNWYHSTDNTPSPSPALNDLFMLTIPLFLKFIQLFRCIEMWRWMLHHCNYSPFSLYNISLRADIKVNDYRSLFRPVIIIRIVLGQLSLHCVWLPSCASQWQPP
jgi:hypothetical protein